MIERTEYLETIRERLKRFPVVSVLGPRQVGKTTLAQAIAGEQPSQFFDLEDVDAQARLAEPKAALERLTGLVVLDEVQRKPELFWATHGGVELDLMVNWQGKRCGFEFKYGDAPSMTKSMHTALRDLKLKRLFVIHPGKDSYAMNDQTEALGIANVRERLTQAGSGGEA